MIMTNINEIVVPIDFSPHSGAALKWAEYLQSQTETQVTVLHCRTYDAPPAFTMEQVDEIAEQALRNEEQVKNEVMSFINDQLGHPVNWNIWVKEGDPAQIIHEHCNCADLIIMGTHGRHGLQHWMLGSVAEAIIHLAKVPVMVVRNVPGISSSKYEINRILVPVNNTIYNEITFNTAANAASIFNAEIYSIYVKEQHDANVIIPDAVNGITVQHIEKTGKPAEQILTAAREISADLIILTAVYKKFLDIDILPSTITQILRYGTVPVIVLPHQMTTIGEKK